MFTNGVFDLLHVGHVSLLEAARAEGAALACVDCVVLFDADTPRALITALRPDVLVKGADYARDDIVGAAEVEAWGGRVVRVPLVPGYSTSDLLARLRRDARR